MPGLPKKYAKMGFKKGWKAFKASKSKRSKSNPKRTSNPKNKGSRKRMAKGFLNASTIMSLVRKGALIAPAVGVAINPNISGMHEKLRYIMLTYTGFDLANPGQFRWDFLAQGWMPYVATTLITKGVQKVSGMLRGL